MRNLTATELSRMRDTQESAMQDLCRILSYREGTDAYGNPDPEYIAGGLVACGLEHLAPKEVQGTGEVPIIDARLRLPIDTVLDPRDRISVVQRYGEDLETAQAFEIVGPPRQGPSGLVVDLRVVDDA